MCWLLRRCLQPVQRFELRIASTPRHPGALTYHLDQGRLDFTELAVPVIPTSLLALPRRVGIQLGAELALEAPVGLPLIRGVLSLIFEYALDNATPGLLARAARTRCYIAGFLVYGNGSTTPTDWDAVEVVPGLVSDPVHPLYGGRGGLILCDVFGIVE
jgi:hypothetical protein